MPLTPRDRLWIRLGVEDHARDVDAGDPVDQSVVGLGEQCEAAVTETLDQPELPEGPAAIKSLGEDTARQTPQLLVGTGPGESGVANVKGRPELRVIDPHRAALVKRHEREPLTVPRDHLQARVERLDQILVGRRRSVEEDACADVHVRPALLELQERVVEPAQAIRV